MRDRTATHGPVEPPPDSTAAPAGPDPAPAIATPRRRGGGRDGAATARDASAHDDYRLLFERSREPQLLQTIDGRILDANAPAAALYGWPIPELVGQSFEVTLAAGDEERTERASAELERDGWFRRMSTGRRRDGSSFPQEVVGTLVSDEGEGRVLIRVTDQSNRLALEAATRQLGDLARLGEIHLDPETIAERATRILVDSFAAHSGALASFESGSLHWRAVVGEMPLTDVLAAQVHPGSEFVSAVFESDAATDVDVERRAAEGRELSILLLAEGIRRLWLIPVLSGDEHRGLIALPFAAPPARGAFDGRRLGAIGRIVGIALHNAYLREEMARELERTEQLEASARVADVVLRQAIDPIIVTDPEFVITRWNAASEALYGVPASVAVGRRMSELIPPFELDGGAIGEALAAEVLRHGAWRGRVIQRPADGARAGEELIVDSVVTVLRDERGHVSGYLGINRDVTATARLEAELTTLGSLAIETGLARSRRDIASAAMAVLRRATSADAALILTFGATQFEIIASHGVSGETIASIARHGRLGRRLGDALADPDAVVALDVDIVPVDPIIRARLTADGVRHVVFVGLRVRGDLVGLLGLGWTSPPANRPSDAAILQAAVLVASALENARLLERLEAGLEEERRLATRLGALIDLTRLHEVAGDDRAMAGFLLDQVGAALGAASALVVREVDGYFEPLAAHNPSPDFERLRLGRPAAQWAFYRRLGRKGVAFVAPLATGSVSQVTVDAALAAGYQAFAAFPIRDDDALVGAMILFFRGPAGEVPVDERTLEAIGRIVQIAFANQWLRRQVVASEARYRTLFEESPDALALQDADGRITDVNRAALRLFAAERETLVGRVLAELLVSNRPAPDEDARPGVTLATARRTDDSTFPAEVIVSRFRLGDEDRELVRIRDLTDQEQIQQEMVQAQKMEAIGQLVAGVAHELTNPLASIIAFSQLLRLDERLPPDMRRDADLLVNEADRTRRIVQNLLQFAGRGSPERVPTSLRELVDTVLELQAYSLNANRISVEVAIPEDLPPVHIDRAEMQQVVLNLTQNAIHAIRSTGRRGTLTISAEVDRSPDGPTIRVAFVDDGPGVAPELRDRLFVPFFTTKGPGEGTGLGLPVSFGIVAAHGGHLGYEPPPNGVGGRFVVTLPLGTPGGGRASRRSGGGRGSAVGATRRDEAGAAGTSPAPEDRPLVLVLDDEPAIRAFLVKALAHGGFSTILAGDGEEAVLRADDMPVAAVLCDYRMAGMTGTDVYTAISRMRPELADRFVIMSGDVLNPELAAFAAERDIALLAKPFDIDAVVRAVRGVVERTPTAPA